MMRLPRSTWEQSKPPIPVFGLSSNYFQCPCLFAKSNFVLLLGGSNSPPPSDEAQQALFSGLFSLPSSQRDIDIRTIRSTFNRFDVFLLLAKTYVSTEFPLFLS
eukprot:m.146326 g.146326  ORF g.146326 m.146326 type:complete len:104 (+) comp52704_c0_seq30:716-1027(+)